MTTAVQPPRKQQLIRAELLKVLTTNTWWIFGIVVLAATALALLVNVFQLNGELASAAAARNAPLPDFSPPPGSNITPPSAAELQSMQDNYLRSIDTARILTTGAANVFTSGQLLNLMFVAVLGVLVVTNEFFHQTATATFLTTPHRTRVVVSKLAAVVAIAAGFWAVTTLINLAVGALDLTSQGYSVPFNEWAVIRSILMNLLAYVVWAVLGLGIGVLIHSQIGATVTTAALYWISWPVALVLFGIIREYIIKQDWVLNFIVALPGVASYVMVAPERLQVSFDSFGPPWWVGAIVLVGYGVVAGVVGTLITRRRDIS